MTVDKRGICIKREMTNWIYEASQIAGMSQNRTIVRMLQIAREDLAAFDDASLRRILGEPWQVAGKMPAFVWRTQRRAQPHLRTRVTIRMTIADKQALGELARKHHTTMSVILRQPLERTVAKETA
ncbi:hypothetical protein MUP07_00745 [Candidatus Bathyarchaeota archaeon]|nr:hypothetical protein [Candidatus Bathyarchaeota archaeon]